MKTAVGVLIGAALAVKCNAFFGGAIAHGAQLSQQSLRMQDDIFTKGANLIIAQLLLSLLALQTSSPCCIELCTLLLRRLDISICTFLLKC